MHLNEYNKLVSSILSGNEKAAVDFVAMKYNLNLKISDAQQTLFQLVVEKNLTAIALYFMEHNVAIVVNTQDKFGNTPLHDTAINGNKILVEALLIKGASPFIKNINGTMPWMFAKRHGHSALAIRLSPSFLLSYPNLFFSSDTLTQKNQDKKTDLTHTNNALDVNTLPCVRK